MTVVSKEVRLMTSSRLLQYFFNNDLRDLKWILYDKGIHVNGFITSPASGLSTLIYHIPSQLVLGKKIAAPGPLSHTPIVLCHSTTCNVALSSKSKMAARGPQKGQLGLERCRPLAFWALLSIFT